ncbi:hypothetical protein, partial [Frankia sp. AgKG'84/4]|uniref:hypothetical protein n=1 Tax=Frankia sp. AgKG'84/4 TaxID=573490 RepID=UPI00202AA42C
ADAEDSRDGTQPASPSGATLGPRGSDDRLRTSVRLTRAERMARAERGRVLGEIQDDASDLAVSTLERDPDS